MKGLPLAAAIAAFAFLLWSHHVGGALLMVLLMGILVFRE